MIRKYKLVTETSSQADNIDFIKTMRQHSR